jgi:hypothetical protein
VTYTPRGVPELRVRAARARRDRGEAVSGFPSSRAPLSDAVEYTKSLRFAEEEYFELVPEEMAYTDGVLRLVLNRVDIPSLTLPARHDLESQVQHVALTDCLSDGASSRHSWMRSVLASEPQYTPRTCLLAEISEVSADTLTEEPAAECSPCDESSTDASWHKA